MAATEKPNSAVRFSASGPKSSTVKLTQAKLDSLMICVKSPGLSPVSLTGLAVAGMTPQQNPLGGVVGQHLDQRRPEAREVGDRGARGAREQSRRGRCTRRRAPRSAGAVPEA